ncbi:hypothetical protein AQS8620_02880 [Aquimixticola soesokkakensis]|uniref:Uncharacterized protein n=1 Tax=Aquimixticola soesokkakensis TaxID=1519096 RepID=A0A1Y5TGC9_9RHOB|nr:GAF domain-containing protein [Aquimixticola soesokkakensis]SLN63098.1 hypothetical protein AQS8620_02880 [Aquimixticola soesokkakensis]
MSAIAEAPPKTFIHVAEVWVPMDGVLQQKSGLYSTKPEFAKASVKESFAKGEGLPGKAWAEARPVVLKEFDGSYFKRSEAAKAAGLTSAVAIPVFAGETLKAVLVVLCGDDAAHAGAIELWGQTGDCLALEDGYYGTAAAFAGLSKEVTFPRGRGLVGGVWAAHTPVLMRDLGASYGFLRAQGAREAGLTTGIGLPVEVPGARDYVLTLLSSQDTPIARRFEIWDARPELVGTTQKALRMDGICAIEGLLCPRENPPTDAVSIGAWQGPVGQVLGSGLPYVQGTSTGLPEGYGSMMALPIYRDGALTHIVAWYL